MTPLTTYECSCEKCRGMCEEQPCIGTYAEIRALVNAGHGNLMMGDYWSGSGGPSKDEDIWFLRPAAIGHEGTNIRNLWPPYGRCTFLVEGLCSIHGMKPLEGRVAICDKTKWDSTFSRRDHIIETWNNPEAQAYAKTFLKDSL